MTCYECQEQAGRGRPQESPGARPDPLRAARVRGTHSRLIHNLVTHMQQARREFQIRQIGHFLRADPDYGQRVADGLGIPLAEIPEAEMLATA